MTALDDRPRRSRVAVVVALALGLVVLLPAAALVLARTGLPGAEVETRSDAAGSGTGGVIPAGSSSVRIDGDVEVPLSPGTGSSIDLSVRNPHAYSVVVDSLAVAVSSVRAPRASSSSPCTVDDFAVTSGRTGTLVIPAHATRTLAAAGVPEESWPTVGMIDASRNQDGCKGASLRLSYTADTEAAR